MIFRNHKWASLLWGILKSTVNAVLDDALEWWPLSMRWNVSPAPFFTTRWRIILSLWKVTIPCPLTTVYVSEPIVSVPDVKFSNPRPAELLMTVAVRLMLADSVTVLLPIL